MLLTGDPGGGQGSNAFLPAILSTTYVRSPIESVGLSDIFSAPAALPAQHTPETVQVLQQSASLQM